MVRQCWAGDRGTMRKVKLLLPRLFNVPDSYPCPNICPAPRGCTAMCSSLQPGPPVTALLKRECEQTEQIVCHSSSLRCIVQLTSLQNFLSSNSKWIHLYMRSISISGSSWNSLIFTVSDRMLFRLHSSSSTWSNAKINVKFSGVYFFLLEKQQHLHQMMLLSLSLFYPRKCQDVFFNSVQYSKDCWHSKSLSHTF